jgi:8-oxo-dGTP diphosphatase
MSDSSLFWAERHKAQSGQAPGSGQQAAASSADAKPLAGQKEAKDAGKGGEAAVVASKPDCSCFKVTVVGFVLHEGKLLVARRSDSKSFLPGYYELPGGHLEAGESPKAGLQREFLEELGVKIEVLEPFHCFAYSSHSGNAVEIVFFAKLAEGVQAKDAKPVDANDVSQVLWVQPSEIDFLKISPQEKQAMLKGLARFAGLK